MDIQKIIAYRPRWSHGLICFAETVPLFSVPDHTIETPRHIAEALEKSPGGSVICLDDGLYRILGVIPEIKIGGDER